MHLLINIIVFKIAWLSSVIGGANELPLLGPAAVLVAIVIHLWFVSEPSREMLLIFSTGIVGAGLDSIMISAGWLSYPSGTIIAGFSPFWIFAMWMLFATTFNISFRWLRERIALAAVLGALSGPFSYYFGEKFGAVALNDFNAAMIALAITWGLALPALLLLAKRLDGTPVPVAEARGRLAMDTELR